MLFDDKDLGGRRGRSLSVSSILEMLTLINLRWASFHLP